MTASATTSRASCATASPSAAPRRRRPRRRPSAVAAPPAATPTAPSTSPAVLEGAAPPRPFRGFAAALALLAAVLAYGTAGYAFVEHFGFLDALFMTVITITTVGYEEVHQLDAAGQVFSITLIVLGVIAFLYTFGVLVEQLSSGRWQN